ncbi:MAG: hypothetical protein ACRDV7_02080 [Acidimicrobiia bacterium]
MLDVRLPDGDGVEVCREIRSRTGNQLPDAHVVADDDCHILNHAEGDQGMFGMVTTLIVQ